MFRLRKRRRTCTRSTSVRNTYRERPLAVFFLFVTRLLLLLVILYEMEADSTPLISSFIIRFVVDEPPTQPLAYHGTIRHIQTAEEMNFTHWHEATEFMHRFVQLTDLLPPSSLASNP